MVGLRPIGVLGAELAYVDFGHPDRLAGLGPPGWSDVSMKGAAAFGMFYLPVPLVDVYAKAGFARLQSTANVNPCPACLNPVAFPPLRRTNTSWAGGAGVQLKLAAAGIRAEYERFKRGPAANPYLLSLGATWTILTRRCQRAWRRALRDFQTVSFSAIAASASLSGSGRAVRGDELARGHLVLGLVDGVDGDELAAAQVTGAEAARRGAAAQDHAVEALGNPDDDELEIELVRPEPRQLVVRGGGPSRLSATVVPCSKALSTDSSRRCRPYRRLSWLAQSPAA